MSEEQFIADLAAERIRTAEEKIETENEVWREHHKREDELYEKLGKILPEEFQQDFQDYCEATYCAWCEKTGDVYSEGVKDGIRLMKTIDKL